jgi:drug/metabolite transporter (DMT)-like permease
MNNKAIVRVGGWSLILGAVAFVAVFSYLAARFDYPAVLDGPASSVLPGLLATGACVGLLTAAAGMIGMFRNVSSAVAPVASVNNYLLPLWMIVLGILLLRWRVATANDP